MIAESDEKTRKKKVRERSSEQEFLPKFAGNTSRKERLIKAGRIRKWMQHIAAKTPQTPIDFLAEGNSNLALDNLSS